MNNLPEILAPAGSQEALKAAVFSGADAVYLGVKELNARRGAENFDYNQLALAARFCHARSVKVYLALNTLINDNEIKTVCKIIECACAVGIDALILQDFATAKIAKTIAPEMPLHASTQMSIQTLDGVESLYKAGFKRVVLPRELNKQELYNICKSSPIETEIFVHGALCMCVSGQCYFSAVLGSRSGNRGACAQPCRLPFSADGSEGNDLSLKDLSLINNFNELAQCGVTSFKIEGRMKRPEYVSAAVTACKQALSGKLESSLKADLQNVFSRTGFTNGYYTSSLGKDMFGIRRKEDVASSASVLKRLSSLYEKEKPRIGVDFIFNAQPNKAVTLSASAGEISAFCDSGFAANEARNHPLTKESVQTQLSKTGGTQFFMKSLQADIAPNINVPMSVLNKLRRNVIEQIENALSSPREISCGKFELDLPNRVRSRQPDIICRFKNEEQIPDDLNGIKEIILPLEGIKTRLDASVELPRAIFGTHNDLTKKLHILKEKGVTTAWAGTLDAMAIANKAGLLVNAGYGSNVFNSISAGVLENAGVQKILLSAELALPQIKALRSSASIGIFAYGRLPLMLTRNCPVKNKKTCAQCQKNGLLIDRKNTAFAVDCSNSGCDLLNSCPLFMADRLEEIKNVDFILLYFTNESKQEVKKIINAYKTGGKAEGKFTRGLLYRGVE